MTNGEKYKTVQERAEAYEKWVEGKCEVSCAMKVNSCIECKFAWLDLEAEDEKPLPCPFCGGECDISVSCVVKCPLCGYSGPIRPNISDSIAAHNRVAKKCREEK